MRNLFKILDKLVEKKVPFCLQTRIADNYNNLAVTDPHGDRKYLSYVKLEDVEEHLIPMWGHLIEIETPSPRMTMVPMPLPPIDGL